MSSRPYPILAPWRTPRVLACTLLALLCAVTACESHRDGSSGSSRAGSNPLTTAERQDVRFSGVVEQRLPAGPYSYHAVRTADRKSRWVVTLGAGVAEGTRVSARVYARRENFQSRRLKRTFDQVLLGVLSPQAVSAQNQPPDDAINHSANR